jgi:uncharacterized protein DUF4350
MSAEHPEPGRPRDWWTRPKVVLPLVGAIAVVVALLTPEPTLGRVGDARLSSHLTGSLGAGALARTAERFGFVVSARDSSPVPDSMTAAGHTIHAVLAPPLEITPWEAHQYMQRVRDGDGLLFVLGERSALADSLHVTTTSGGGLLRVPTADTAGCKPLRTFVPPLWPDGRVRVYGLLWTHGEPPAREIFARRMGLVEGGRTRWAEAAAGIELGAGRVALVADPDLLRNDVLARCTWGADVIAMQMMEWLRAGGAQPRTALVFDEYHQGYNHRESLAHVVWSFLVGHPLGRALLALAIAGLVLLLAVGPRALPPRDSEMIERRDPLEQVDALAHAYSQVKATRTATVRLLRVLRQRVEGTATLHRARADEAFLADVARAQPARADDVALIERALREPLPARDLPLVAAALRRLEESLLTTHA